MPRIGCLHPIHSEGTDSVDAGQIHGVERLVSRESSCNAHSRSFQDVGGRRSTLYEAGPGCSGSTIHFFVEFMTFPIHRGSTPIGECNTDAIRKQLKMAS